MENILIPFTFGKRVLSLVKNSNFSKRDNPSNIINIPAIIVSAAVCDDYTSTPPDTMSKIT